MHAKHLYAAPVLLNNYEDVCSKGPIFPAIYCRNGKIQFNNTARRIFQGTLQHAARVRGVLGEKFGIELLAMLAAVFDRTTL